VEILELGLENGYRLLMLAIPAFFGALVGRLGLFGDNERAIDILNVYALYIGFPALVFVGVIDDSFTIPRSAWFWAVVPVAHALSVGAIAFVAKNNRGTLALVGLFGNIAYLGLPLVIGLYGEEVTGIASLIVAIHVAISVSAGPYLLQRWNGSGGKVDLTRVLRLPVLWAPFIGIAARALPRSTLDHIERAASPIAASAAPVAIFLLGLYVWTRREVIAGQVQGALSHIATRLFVVPAFTAAVTAVAVAFGDLPLEQARVFVVLSGMPAAITTFSLAHDAGVGGRVVAATIVRTTLLAVIMLPLLATLVSAATS
jgi:predicted permease